jgi:Fe-S cluster assembly ATP-binding protein
MGILETKELTLAFNGSRILGRLNIDFWGGHVHAIIGPNGAGKSTLASTIMGWRVTAITGGYPFRRQVDQGAGHRRTCAAGHHLGLAGNGALRGADLREVHPPAAKDKSVDRAREAIWQGRVDRTATFKRAVDRT